MYKGDFPGIELFYCQGDNDAALLHALVEYEGSAFLEQVMDASERHQFKHYRLFLSLPSVAIHVVAQTVVIAK